MRAQMLVVRVVVMGRQKRSSNFPAVGHVDMAGSSLLDAAPGTADSKPVTSCGAGLFHSFYFCLFLFFFPPSLASQVLNCYLVTGTYQSTRMYLTIF